MIKPNKVWAVPMRLCLLAFAALALTSVAIADGCNDASADCGDGSQVTVSVCCPTGYLGYDGCVCTTWTESGGYSNCGLGWTDCEMDVD